MKKQELLVQPLKISEQAASLTIVTAKDMVVATEFLSQANKLLDTLKEAKEERTYRLKEQIKLEEAPFKEPQKMLTETVAIIRTKMSQYQTEAAQQAAKEQAAIAARASKGTLKPETAVRKLGEIDTPEIKVATSNGSITFRPKETLTITDLKQLPRDYLIPNEDLLLTDLKEGKTIPGACITIVQVPYNRRV